MATGTVTKTDVHSPGAITRRVDFDCLSDASGNVASDAFRMPGYQFQRAETIPDGGGTAPTAYNLQVRRRSATGLDLLNGSGATRSATVAEECRPEDDNGNAELAPCCYDEDLYLTADTVGNAKGFNAYLYFIRA